MLELKILGTLRTLSADSRQELMVQCDDHFVNSVTSVVKIFFTAEKRKVCAEARQVLFFASSDRREIFPD